MRAIVADLPALTAEDVILNPEKHDPWIPPRHGRLDLSVHRAPSTPEMPGTSPGMTYESCTKGLGIGVNIPSVFQSQQRLEHGEY